MGPRMGTYNQNIGTSTGEGRGNGRDHFRGISEYQGERDPRER